MEKLAYPHSHLVITQGEFCKLLNDQIAMGEELLKIEVPFVSEALAYDPYTGRNQVVARVYEEAEEQRFINSFKRWNNRNKEIYRSSFALPNSIYFHEYEDLDLHIWGRDSVKEYKGKISAFMNHMQSDIDRADLFQCTAPSSKNPSIESRIAESKDVFIVHGHNNEIKQTVARYVERLGLNPIILHEQPNGGSSIIDKFETNAEKSSFAIIILSADDLAASSKELKDVPNSEIHSKLTKRARENVVFEMGFFFAIIGRSRILLLCQDGVTTPGDIDGLVYTKYDEAGAWGNELVRELRNAGYQVSADDLP